MKTSELHDLYVYLGEAVHNKKIVGGGGWLSRID